MQQKLIANNIQISCSSCCLYDLFNVIYVVSVVVRTASLSDAQYAFSLSRVWGNDNLVQQRSPEGFEDK